ncbi:hypothetical protein C7C46_30910 [Streptomyces tateyamensis]|uniref:DUF3828 domain-containing protein n=1 Tax=Streptomyces tateyamensis TaxID=565073 RepID=A0A2V4N7R9_9ACTN|nr:hypothetical protein [Streptomyces tateyamensis]PYC66775.1 hypothetical protein C7C46_30910 [Streptomyces tateyamensis]
MTRLRSAAAALALSAAAVLPIAAPAHAESRAEAQVNAFFGQYRDAVLGQNPNQDPTDVREEFMTSELNTELDQWAADHDADPVFRAQNVPSGWSVAYGGSGAGHSTVILTEYWAGGGHTDVWYQVRLDTLRIDGLEDAPQ